MELEEQQPAPDITLNASNGKPLKLRDLRGKWVILYFYPKDDTPGCTREACSFRDNLRRLEAMNAVVLGVSPDGLKAHDKFINKYELPFTLLSDEDHKASVKFGAWKEKTMYGRKLMGIERSTFLIDPEGKIHRIWRKVKVDGHVDEVLDELRAVNAA